jgi:hypothetical protein
LLRAHDRYKREKEAQYNKDKEARLAKRAKEDEELKAKVEESKAKAQEKKKDGGVKEPPFMDFLMNFLGSLKIHVNRIHIRYEDDYFNHTRPFAFGFMIDSIVLDNSVEDWTFENELSVRISKNQPE